MAEEKVVVVGGGCAGLSAAWQLKKAGVPFTLYESSERYGGRVIYRETDDIIWNDGAGFTEPQWGTTFEYLKEFGMADAATPKEGSAVYGLWYNNKVNYFDSGDNLFQGLLSVAGLPKGLIGQGLKFLPSFAKDLMLVGRKDKGDGDKDHDYSKLDKASRVSTREYCESKGAPDVADMLLGPMLGTMTLARTCDVSAAHPIALLGGMQGMVGVTGGLKIINDAIYDRIQDDVCLNTPVEEVVIEDGAVKGVKLAGGEFIETSKVIVATDATIAAQIMPGAPEEILKALNSCTYSKSYHYVFYVPEKFVPDDFVGLFIPESENSLITTIFAGPITEEFHVPGTEAKHDFSGNAMVLHTFTAGWHDDEFVDCTQEERLAKVEAEVAKFFPDAAAKMELVGESRYERAINLVPPGQFDLTNKLMAEDLAKVEGLYLGGEYLFLVACTEGAWKTGKEAGLAVIADLQ